HGKSVARSMLRQLALRHQLGIPLPPPCTVPAPFPTMLRLRHGAIPSLPARGGSRAAGSRHSTPRDRRTAGDAAAPGSNARHEREILGSFVPRAKRVCWDMETLRSLSTAASRSQGVQVTPQALL